MEQKRGLIRYDLRHEAQDYVDPKHLDRYVTEFSGRHNERDRDTIIQMTRMVEGMVGERLRYRDLNASTK